MLYQWDRLDRDIVHQLEEEDLFQVKDFHIEGVDSRSVDQDHPSQTPTADTHIDQEGIVFIVLRLGVLIHQKGMIHPNVPS